MFDAAVAAIPPEHNALFTALMFGSRGMVRHHGKELVIVAEGYRRDSDAVMELLDSYTQGRQELIDVVKEFQAGVTSLRTEVAAGFARVDGQITVLRADVDALADAQSVEIPSRASAPSLREQIARVEADSRWRTAGVLILLFLMELIQWVYIVWTLTRPGGA
jgi:hypothetical protein